jgi:predicted RNA-binding protein (virulence factor B family)
MDLRSHLGQRVTLRVERLTQYGAALGQNTEALPPEGARVPTVLLPRREVKPDLAVGHLVDVFLYLDSEDRLTATMLSPRLALGEVVFLRATAHANFGTFFDWGLGKELLVPLGEQTRDVRIGERHPIGLIIDGTGRLAGTMKIAELLEQPHAHEVNQWLEGQVWRYERGLGLFVILGRRRAALLPENEVHELRPGHSARFRVSAVLPDGKIRLSLRGLAHTHLADDGETILAALSQDNPPRLSDDSDPEDIREALGLSKKAFKRAVGGLLKARRVIIDDAGYVALADRSSRK